MHQCMMSQFQHSYPLLLRLYYLTWSHIPMHNIIRFKHLQSTQQSIHYLCKLCFRIKLIVLCPFIQLSLKCMFMPFPINTQLYTIPTHILIHLIMITSNIRDIQMTQLTPLLYSIYKPCMILFILKHPTRCKYPILTVLMLKQLNVPIKSVMSLPQQSILRLYLLNLHSTILVYRLTTSHPI